MPTSERQQAFTNVNRAQLQLLNSHTGFRSNSLTDTYGLYALPCFGLDQDWSIWVLRAAFGHVFVRETTILDKPAYLPLVNTATKGNIKACVDMSAEIVSALSWEHASNRCCVPRRHCSIRKKKKAEIHCVALCRKSLQVMLYTW